MRQTLQKEKLGFPRERRFQQIPEGSARPVTTRSLRAPWSLLVRGYQLIFRKDGVPLTVRFATRVGQTLDWGINSSYRILLWLVISLHGITLLYAAVYAASAGVLRNPFPVESSFESGTDLPFFASSGDTRKIFSYTRGVPEHDHGSVRSILTKSTRRSLGSTESEELSRAIVSESHKQQVDPVFVATLIRHESGFRRSVVSSAGAVGLMQLLPSTGRFVCGLRQTSWGGSQRLCSPAYNLQLGITYLKYLLRQFPQNLSHMLIAYNWGPGNLQRALKHRRTIPRGPISYARSIIRDYQRARGIHGVEPVSPLDSQRERSFAPKKSKPTTVINRKKEPQDHLMF